MPQLSNTAQFVLYFVASNALAAVTIYPILQQSPTYYAAGVQLSRGVSTLVLANWLVAVAVVVGKVLQVILFGELRLIEIEHIYENSRFTVLNSLFTLAMFSNETLLVPGFLVLILLFVKVFHWILKDRYEHIFQHATRPSEIFLTRNSLTLLLLLYLDFGMVYSCAEYTFGNSPDVFFAFGFEFAILFFDLVTETAKIALNTWEVMYLTSHPDEETMESKAMYMKILNIVHTALNLAIYSFLLYTFLSPYRFPIYLFKDIFYSILSLNNQIRDLQRYLKAARELDSRLADATEEDLADDNTLCIICRDDMTTEGVAKGENLYPKKLGCGHIIHMGCLKGWFERSQVCPMCRAPVFTEAPAQQAPRPPPPQQQQVPQGPPLENVRAGPDDAPHLHDAHLPHGNGFFQAPRNEEPEPQPQQQEQPHQQEQAPQPDILLLPHNAFIPPDWTVFKLSNGNASHDEYTLHLSSTQVAKIERVLLDPATAEPIPFRGAREYDL